MHPNFPYSIPFLFLTNCTNSPQDHNVSSTLRVLHCMWLPRTIASSDDVDSFRLWKTSHHALQWDGCLLESQEGLENKVGLRAYLVGASGSVAWFYVNGECGGYEIERSISQKNTHVYLLSIRTHCREAY
ncbi:hypothetical protein M9H77_24409 [Catharanthus roseus]|uniref:Uncharacterized protein n=1 Tax=Catharanthus roseus TaxID=4058 RepID=A0ACC0B017_CATRO|nr:hypothetical protein M9H77_24409 [Catharanthus roseus]